MVLALLAATPLASQGPARLVFVGDVLLARGVRAEIQSRGGKPWGAMQALLRRATWSAANLEGAVGSARDCAAGAAAQNLCFSIPPRLVPLLRAAGFAALSVENNHAADLGPAGRTSTARALVASGLDVLSFERSPVFARVAGHEIAAVAFSEIPGRDGGAISPPSPELAQKLRLAHQLANLVIVFVHWGNELQDWPSARQWRDARWLIAQGADLIVGSHPHVIQRPACISGKPVFFSLGNNLFDQRYAPTHRGMAVDCRLRSHHLRCAAWLTARSDRTFYPRLLGHDPVADRVLGSCQPALHPTLRIDGVELRPWTQGPGPQGAISLVGLREGRPIWRTRSGRLAAAASADFAGRGRPAMLFTLERHLSSIDDEVGLRPYVYAVGRKGLIARWRGSALAWPIVDARPLPGSGLLCALHRGDSFLLLAPQANRPFRTAAYRWDGFGFSGVHDASVMRACVAEFAPELPPSATLLSAGH